MAKSLYTIGKTSSIKKNLIEKRKKKTVPRAGILLALKGHEKRVSSLKKMDGKRESCFRQGTSPRGKKGGGPANGEGAGRSFEKGRGGTKIAIQRAHVGTRKRKPPLIGKGRERGNVLII